MTPQRIRPRHRAAIRYEIEQICYLLDLTDNIIRTTRPSKKVLLGQIEYLTIAVQRLTKELDTTKEFNTLA